MISRTCLSYESGSSPSGNVRMVLVLFFLKEAMWALDFICLKILNYMFNLLNRLGTFRYSNFSYVSIGKFLLSRHLYISPKIFKYIA